MTRDKVFHTRTRLRIHTVVGASLVQNTSVLSKRLLRELPIGGQNDDLGGVFVTSFGEGVHHVAAALPENS